VLHPGRELRIKRQVVGPALNIFSVLLGNGDGTFQAPINTTVPSPGGPLLVGDLNGDGKLDVLTQGLSYLGKGDGTFLTGMSSGAPGPGTFDMLADFNGDGKPDLFILGVGIQLGNGNGTFQALLPFPTDALTGFVVGDFNGDGKLDVAGFGTSNNHSESQILFGNGDGTFQPGPVNTLPSGSLGSNPVAADLNHDGKADVIFEGTSIVRVFKNNGDGSFTVGKDYNTLNQYTENASPAYSNIVVADFNGDGKLDVAVFNTLLAGNGDGTLQGNEVSPILSGSGLTGDFNKDGHPDLALFVASNSASAAQLEILLNDGKGNFSLANTYQIPVAQLTADALSAAVDLNGDGEVDLTGYTYGHSASAFVLLGNGDGSFGPPTTAPGGRGSAFADLNGDHKLDVIVPSPDGSISVFLNNGDGTFAAPVGYFAGPPYFSPGIGLPNNVVVGDFNKDGKMDVAVGAQGLGIAVLLGNGDGTLQPATFVSTGLDQSVPPIPIIADVNGDGNADLIVSGTVTPSSGVTQDAFQVLLGKGDGSFTGLTPVTGTESIPLQVADFNGDVKVDILGGIKAGLLALFLGNGDGTFSAPIPLLPGTALIGDFNGDGQPDLAILGPNVFLFNTTVPGFQISASALSPTAIASGGSATSTITLSPVGGFSGAVALTCSGLPAGASCGFAPASVANASGTSALTITTTAATPASTYTVNVIGTSGSGTHQVSLTVNVTAPVAPDFSMTAGSGGTATVAPGQTATYALSLTPSGGFGGSVTLTCSGAPNMATCSISPATVPLSGTTATTATVTVTTTAASQVFLPGGTDAFRRMGRPPMMLAAWLMTALALFGLYRARGNQRFRWAPAVAMALVVFAGLGLASCGGGNSSGGGGGGTGTDAGTYTITVSASAPAGSTTLSHSTKLTLVVQ
jgi:FG-GAP-like repeat